MKRERVLKDDPLCACGHLECKKVVENAIKVFQQHLSKTRTLIDAKQKSDDDTSLQKIVKELHITLSEVEKRVQKLEEMKINYGRSAAEYYKRESINVRAKYNTPIMRWAFDQVEAPANTPSSKGRFTQKKKRKTKPKVK